MALVSMALTKYQCPPNVREAYLAMTEDILLHEEACLGNSGHTFKTLEDHHTLGLHGRTRQSGLAREDPDTGWNGLCGMEQAGKGILSQAQDLRLLQPSVAVSTKSGAAIALA